MAELKAQLEAAVAKEDYEEAARLKKCVEMMQEGTQKESISPYLEDKGLETTHKRRKKVARDKSKFTPYECCVISGCHGCCGNPNGWGGVLIASDLVGQVITSQLLSLFLIGLLYLYLIICLLYTSPSPRD